MKNIAWLTDIHLNFLDYSGVTNFCEGITAMDPDAVLITGDIGDADSIRGHLSIIENIIKRPIYFVLGNHDFYSGSIRNVRSNINDLVKNSKWLHWMDIEGVIKLSDTTCIVGHSGWADGRFGNTSSRINLNDYFFINEFIGLGLNERFMKLNQIGDEAAAYVKHILPEALDNFKFILFITHVPPFKEACWYRGSISDDDWLPHFSCKSMGDVLFEAMQKYPDRRMTVLCGHTHSSGEAQILPNLLVKTGKAKYGVPEIQELIEIP